MCPLPFTFLMNIYSIVVSAANPSVYQYCVPKIASFSQVSGSIRGPEIGYSI